MKLCGERKIYILTPLPRYILVPCCNSDAHCVNLVVKDAASKQGVFDIMDELDLMGKAVSIKFASCTVLCTGDLLVAKQDAMRREVLDAMISAKAKKIEQRKRAASPEASATGGASGSGPSNTYQRNVRGRSGSEPGYNFVPGPHPNQRGGWLPGFTRGGSRSGGGRGGGGRGGRGRGRGRAASHYY